MVLTNKRLKEKECAHRTLVRVNWDDKVIAPMCVTLVLSPYVYTLFPFYFSHLRVNIVLFMVKDTSSRSYCVPFFFFFVVKTILFLFWRKENRVLTYIYICIYMYVYLYISIHTHIWIYIMLACFSLAIMQPRGHDRLSLWLAPQWSRQNVEGENFDVPKLNMG